MPSQKNFDQVKSLVEDLKISKAVILADYSHLSVADQGELRQLVKAAGGRFTVAKNNLFRLALKTAAKPLPDALDKALNGPTAFLFAFEDEIAPIKVFIEFTGKHELPKTKLGLLFQPEDRILSVEEIEKLAKLPTRQELVGQFIGVLNSPRRRLVSVLSGNLRKLVFVLSRINKQKQATN